MQAHWGLPDPATVQGIEAEIMAAFADTYRRLGNRVQAFVDLPFDALDLATLKTRMQKIGQMDDTT